MHRRRFLGRAGAAGTAGLAGLAGCLERLGFEEESAWRNPPLVEDRPEAVYVPASTEGMGTYGSASDGEYALALSYTFPHRFWTVTGSERTRVEVGTDDTLHLMCTVWEPSTGTVLPVDMDVEITSEGESVRQFAPWPMLSQRMGFHYGDNVELPGEGRYTARVRVGPVQARRTGAFAERFGSAATLEVDFEYARSDVHDLPYETVAHDRRGEPGALEPMAHGGGDADSGDGHSSGGDDGDGHHDEDDAETHNDGGDHGSETDDPGPPPSSAGPAVEDLPGRLLGTKRTGDAAVSVLETDLDRLTGDANGSLAVFPRTPYNDVPLPFTQVHAAVERNGGEIAAGSLRETLDPELGHHYGVDVPALESGDRITVSIETPPTVSRHDGYETAFFEFDDAIFEV